MEIAVVVLAVVVVVLLILAIVAFPDLRRYLRMRKM